MTARERFNNQMHFKPFDRSFNMEFGFWEENYTQWPLLHDSGITNENQANIFFGFDRIEDIWANAWMVPQHPIQILEETDRHIIRINNHGVVEQVFKSGDAGSTIPHYIRPSIQTPDDWKRVKENHFRRDDPARDFDYARLDTIYRDDRDFPGGVGCGSMIGRVRDMMTVEGLAYAMYDYPDMVEDMVETCCVLVEDALDKLLPRYTFDFASGWEDICFKNGPLVSLDFFKNVVAPRYKRINAKLKAHGIDIWYIDCDGDVRHLLPTFLESGINCLFPYEVNSCVHPGELLDQYGGELRIMGGFDKMQLIAGPEAIKTYMQSLEKWVAKGGYIPFCDHRCPPDVKPEDYLYYLDLKEKMFGI